MLCTNIALNVKTKTNNFCTQHDVVNLYFSGNSMNNLLSYCGLIDARMRASEKDLPLTLFIPKSKSCGSFDSNFLKSILGNI